ncbi:probable inactive receptor kinase At4g23740 [Rhodamnia argentea]|uniref:Probable inactive receptor kinase At4g23740 n=1 Tax=Rhodamnia argentea TaxID=178133 RepID=A0A8B8PMX7_9MYRT|nr:probable inactive receptor kinase At4g23740 [Rhodamnia argentea]XP_048137721.1 probable inactive receptor kinase At4g23740 [Rhodamnia argentea]
MEGKFVVFLTILLLGSICSNVLAKPEEDERALLDFLGNVSLSRPLNWNKDSSVCQSWTGVLCNKDQSRVIALRLPRAGISGPIPPSTLSRLSALQILGLRWNSMSGSLPSDFSKLKNLTGLHLQSNSFSGPLPSDWSVWPNLTVVNLSNNEFNGSIPSSISNSTYLTTLDLANNSLSGEIPDLYLPNLQMLDLSNNDLAGRVPRSLQRFPSQAFVGNNVSFEDDASPPALRTKHPGVGPPKNASKLSEPALIGIVIGGCLLGVVAIALFTIMFCSRGGIKRRGLLKSQKRQEVSQKKRGVAESEEKDNKIVFFEGCNYTFDLEDLLRASAEVLGKGTFGASYKAALEDATTMVVKRLKEVSAGRKEFEQQMEMVGRIRHENVAQLRAYYCSKDEKLLVYDFYGEGSVSSLLHGDRCERRGALDWETRLKIAIGTARGIAHIHTQNGGKLAHGNMKSSNIFLNPEGFGCVSDVALAPVMDQIPLPLLRISGYRAPEMTDSRKPSQASDVYGFGVLLLELLTGKSPMHATSSGDEVIHLVRWVNSVVREEWTAEVFDMELLRYPSIEEEMVEMLQIGMACVARMPEQRPKMPDVLRKVEEIRREHTATEPSPEIKSPGSTSAPSPTREGAETASPSARQS